MNEPAPASDRLAAPFLERLRNGQFALPRCDACGGFHFYPRPVCPHCQGTRFTWAAASGGGMVYSFSVVHRAPSPRFADDVPYVVAIVRTDEGPHLMARITGVAPPDVRIGLRVHVKIRIDAEGMALPFFEPA